MKALFLTNFYPPTSRGGYEEWCYEVTQTMRAHGHDIQILTSRHEAIQLVATDDDWVHRELYLEMELASLSNGLGFFTTRSARAKANLKCLRQHLADLTPDVVLIWGMWNLQRALPVAVEQLMPGRTVYYMGDYWPTLPSQFLYYWQAPAQSWKTFVPKAILGFCARQILARETLPVPVFEHILFPTQFMQDEFQHRGVKYQHGKVIYGAADTSVYQRRCDNRTMDQTETTTLLYVGRLIHDKGAHTAINALASLVHQHDVTNIELLLAGTGDSDYEAYLAALLEEKQVQQWVTFLGPVPKSEMPALYDRADVFLFTSIWPEPFGRVLIEAMATGIVVIGSATGGAAEILCDEENALTFAPDDAAGLTRQLLRLIKSPTLYTKLAHEGYRTAKEKFGIARMSDEISSYLHSLLQGTVVNDTAMDEIVANGVMTDEVMIDKGAISTAMINEVDG